MTYEQALDWLEKNVPLGNYDNFSDWYEACQDKLNTPNLFSSPEFNRMLEQAWLNEFGSFDREEIDNSPSQAESEQRRIDITEEQRAKIKTPRISIPRIKPPTISIHRRPNIIPVIVPKEYTGGAPIRLEPTIGIEGTKMTRPPIPRPIIALSPSVPHTTRTKIITAFKSFLSRFRRKK